MRHNYTRFAILHYQRSGSRFLQNLLGSHPACVCWFRPFGPDLVHDVCGDVFDKNKWLNYLYVGEQEDRRHKVASSDLWTATPETLVSKANDPVATLNMVFSSYATEVRAVGVKIAFSELDDDWNGFGRASELESYLEANDLKFIVLKRRDLLAQYYSHVRALQTNEWHIEPGDNKQKLSLLVVRVDPAQFETWLRRLTDYYLRFNALVQRGMAVDYEELVSNRDQTLVRLFQFLGIEFDPDSFAPLIPTKGNTYDIKDVITNYDELQDHFWDTEWEHLFQSRSTVSA